MVELSMIWESRAWHNFAKAHLGVILGEPSVSTINESLKEYRARIVDYRTQTVTFDTEQDKMFFILKWA